MLATLACAAVLSGCLGDDGEPAADQPIRGHVLNLYASSPTEGPSAATARAVARGSGRRWPTRVAAPGATGSA